MPLDIPRFSPCAHSPYCWIQAWLSARSSFFNCMWIYKTIVPSVAKTYHCVLAYKQVPVPQPHPQYWDGLDWVALHFLVVTAGNYDPITHARVNITISHDLEWREIFVVEKTNHKLPLAFHSAALACTGLAFVLLPLFFACKIRHPGCLALLLLLSWVCLAISGVAIVMDARMPNNDRRISQPNVAIPMQWTAVVCVFLASVLQTYEYLLWKWMSSRKRVFLHNRPDELSWFRYNRKRFSASILHSKKDKSEETVQELDLSIMESSTMRSMDDSPLSKQISLFVPSPIRSPRSARSRATGNDNEIRRARTVGSDARRGHSRQDLPSIVLDPAD
jgi:hypothetical protein